MGSSKSRRPSSRHVIVGLLVVVVGVYIAERRLTAYSASPYPVVQTIPFRPIGRALASLPPVAETFPMALSFQRGETLGEVLEDLGLSATSARDVLSVLSPWIDPRRIRPSDHYSVAFDQTGVLRSFEMAVAKAGVASAVRNQESGWSGRFRPFERTVRVRSMHGVLDGGLESSISAAGGPTKLAILMADVFQWDLDFTRDLRVGDKFDILFETNYLDGKLDSLGSILAVSYTNKGDRLEAYRFGEDDGYYDADGRPMRKMFLRSPMRYSRITSRFSQRRFHPVLKRHRPHYGVDYGAPNGTPVRTTANGVVAFSGWDGGSGKTVKVRHPNSYLTAYLHLSRFAEGVRRGTRVSQGEVIGYVGSTGLSTAPHLDYRVQHHGRWIDPLSLKSVPAEPVPHRRLPEFLAWRDSLRQSLLEDRPLGPDLLDGRLRVAERESLLQGIVGGR